MEIYNLSSDNEESSKLTITAIKPAVRSENRANIFINDNYEFSLDLAQVVDFKLKVGQNITAKKLNEYKHASEFGKLYQRTLEWVLTRPHSIKETYDYLNRKLKKCETENRQAIRNRERSKEDREKYHLRTKELPLFSDNDIEKIITRLVEKNYLNDYEFARYFLENRNAAKGSSVKKLKLELAKKGIEKTIIDEFLADNIRNDEEEIQKIIAKKRQKYDDEKLINYLVRQGFPFELVRQAVSETDSQNLA